MTARSFPRALVDLAMWSLIAVLVIGGVATAAVRAGHAGAGNFLAD